MADDILTKEETRKVIFSIMAATMRGETSPVDLFAHKHFMRAEDIEAATAEVNNFLAEHLDKIPSAVSGDMTIQEVIRQRIDQAMMDHVMQMRMNLQNINK